MYGACEYLQGKTNCEMFDEGESITPTILKHPRYMRYKGIMCIQYIPLNHLMDSILTSMGTSVNVTTSVPQ